LGRDKPPETTMKKINAETVKAPTPEIEDSGKVRLGWGSPSLPPVRVTPAEVEDNGKVRLGWGSPSL
jgi:hypothetical protein